MYSLNRASILGNTTRDPELRTTPNGQNVCSLSVATNYSYTDKAGTRQDKTEYHNIVLWGKLADIANQYTRKGSKVYIEGRIQTRDWEDQQGQKKYRTEIVAENIILLDRKGATPGAEAASAAPSSAPVASADEEIKLEEVPF